MRVLISLLAATAIAGHAAPAAADAPAPKPPPAKTKQLQVAVFQLEAAGVEQKVSTIVSDAIIAELSKAREIKVIGSKEIDAMLNFEQKKQMTGCTDTSCMVALGGALGVDKILTGNIGKLGESYVFNLKLLDIRTATMDGLYNNRLKGGTEEAFLDLVPVALSTLFPATALTRGAARMDGDSTRPGATARPPVSTYAPWIVMGAGAAALVAGGITHALAAKDFSDYETLPESDPNLKDTWRSINTKANVAYALYGAGVLVAAGGLTWYFVERPEDSSKTALQISPAVSASAWGAVMTGNW